MHGRIGFGEMLKRLAKVGARAQHDAGDTRQRAVDDVAHRLAQSFLRSLKIVDAHEHLVGESETALAEAPDDHALRRLRSGGAVEADDAGFLESLDERVACLATVTFACGVVHSFSFRTRAVPGNHASDLLASPSGLSPD